MSEDDEYLDRRAVTGSGTGLFVGFLLSAVLIGGVGAIVATARTHNAVAIVVVVIAVLVAGSRLYPLIVAPVAKGTVRLSTRGILTSGPLLELQVDWAEIVGIDVLKRGRGRSVSLLLRDGTRRDLAAPREQGLGRSPEFDEQVAKICRWWESYRPANFVPPEQQEGAVRRRRPRRSGTPRRRVVRPTSRTRPTLTRSTGRTETPAAATATTQPATEAPEPTVTAATTEPITTADQTAFEPSPSVADQSMVVERPRRGRWRR